MKTFKFNKIEYRRQYVGSSRRLTLTLLSDDSMTCITFSSSAYLASYECVVRSKKEVLWEKKVKGDIPKQGTLGATMRGDFAGLKLVIAACLSELVMLGYMPVGSFEWGDETVQINPHDAPIEAIELPPDL